MNLPEFHVSRRTKDGFEVLAPSGRITLGQNVRDLKQAFEDTVAGGHKHAILNLYDVPYVDSAGLGTIVTGLNLFRKSGGDLLLASVQQRVGQLIELTHLTGTVAVYSTEEDAIRAFRDQAAKTA